jgi:putative transposase
MMRHIGRSKKGEIVYDIKPFYRGSRVTVVGAISEKKVIAMKTMGTSMNGEDFKKFVQEELAPKLWKGAVVVMDNLRAHKVKGVEEMIEAVGARVVYLSPYSPEFNLRRTFMVGTKGIAQEIHTSKCTDSGKTLGIGSEIMFK